MRLGRVAVGVIVSAVLLSGCSIGTPEPATYVTDVSATLNGVVYSNEPGEIVYWFNYGTTTDYGTVTPDRTFQIPAGSEDDARYPVSEPIEGLEPNTTYHYQVCTSPGAEPGSRGCTNQDQTFTTGPAGAGRPGIAFDSSRDGDFDIQVMDADGTDQTALTNAPGSDVAPAWSPDATQIAFVSQRDGPGGDIYVMDADGSDPQRLTNDAALDTLPDWSPDGDRIAFVSERTNGDNVWVMNSDGSDQIRLTTQASSEPRWSPDGRRIAFSTRRDGNVEIYVMNADGSGQTNLTNSSTTTDATPVWSPDGRRIAFAVSPAGGGPPDVYVMDADGTDRTNLTNLPGIDWEPEWSRDGSRIAFASFRDGNSEIYTMAPDGSNPVNLTNHASNDRLAAWSPHP